MNIIFAPVMSDAGLMHDIFKRTAALIDGIGAAKVYRIIDLRGIEAQVSFGDMVQSLAVETKSGELGSSSDPRMLDVMVATTDMLKLGAKSMGQEQYLGRELPIFPTLDEALAYARTEITKR
jgi:hypothetical protein